MKKLIIAIAFIGFCSFLDKQTEKKYALTDADINTIYISVNECKDITPNQRDSVLSHIVPQFQMYKQAELKDSTKK